MSELTDKDEPAIAAAIQAMAEAIGEIGFERSPMEWTIEQVRGVATAAIKSFLENQIPF